MNDAAVERISAELIALLGSGRQVVPFTRRGVPFGLDEAYRIASRVADLRQALGQTPVGRKIGFTNRSIWAGLGIDAPIWNFVFDATVQDAVAGTGRIALSGMPEPRIEPEIALHLAVDPAPGMTTGEVADCVDWAAPAFEIVYSIFPGWDFSAADAAAAYGVHGALIVGERMHLPQTGAARAGLISSISVELQSDRGQFRAGHAGNVLGGPIEALTFLVEELARYPVCPPLRAGELVTTGTLTEAMPGRPGEVWTARFDGAGLQPLHLRLE